MITLLRTLQLVSAAVLVGAAAYQILIWAPAMRALAENQREPVAGPMRRRLLWLTLVSALLLMGGAVADLLRIAALFSQEGWLAPSTISIAMELVTGTDLGRFARLRVVAALLLLACRPWRWDFGWARQAVTFVAGLAVLATFSLTGHAAAAANALAVVPADLIHLTATATWFGGLLCLALLPWGRLQPGTMIQAVGRFSNLGLAAMGVLALTGIYLAVLRLYGFRALVEDPYGLTLFVKLGIIVGVLALAGLNYRLVRQGRLAESKPLRWFITGEAVLGLAVVVAAGVLSTTPPPRGEPIRLQVTVDGTSDHWHDLTVVRGKPVRLTFQNLTPERQYCLIRDMPHEMLSTAGGHQHGATQDMDLFPPAKKPLVVSFIPRRTGEFELSCTTYAGTLDPVGKVTVIDP